MGHVQTLLKTIVASLPHDNPGAARISEQSLEQMTGLPYDSQTLVFDWAHGKAAFRLARLLEFGSIHVSPVHPIYGKFMEQRNQELGLEERLCIHTGQERSTFVEVTYNMIWSEGSVHGRGFENALHSWNKLLKPGGYLGISNGCWQTDSKQPNCVNRGSSVVTDSLQKIAASGYHCLAHYTIPYQVWWDGYYQPLRQQITHFKRQVDGDEEKELLAMLEDEVELFLASMEYGFYHNYEFYVCQKSN